MFNIVSIHLFHQMIDFFYGKFCILCISMLLKVVYQKMLSNLLKNNWVMDATRDDHTK